MNELRKIEQRLERVLIILSGLAIVIMFIAIIITNDKIRPDEYILLSILGFYFGLGLAMQMELF